MILLRTSSVAPWSEMREPDLQRFVGQLPDLRRESAGGNGDVAGADVQAPGRIDDPDGADHVGEVGQRFAHAHEDDVVDLFAARLFHREELLHDLARLEVAGEAVQPARAKFAAVGAADLGGDADRAPVGGLAVERGRGGNEDRLDEIAIRQPERNFRVVSFEPRTRTVSSWRKSNASASRFLSSCGRSLIASNEVARFS